MVGRLISADLIEDDENSYNLARQLDDWPSRESAITSSKMFVDFMDPDIVDDDAVRIVNSQRIGEAVKRKILEDPRSYCSSLNPDDLRTMCQRAVDFTDLSLGEDALMFFAEHDGNVADVIALLGRAIGDLEDTSIRRIIQDLGDPYEPLLIRGNRKIKVPKAPGLEEILNRLKTVGAVSSYTLIDDDSKFQVHRRHQ